MARWSPKSVIKWPGATPCAVAKVLAVGVRLSKFPGKLRSPLVPSVRFLNCVSDSACAFIDSDMSVICPLMFCFARSNSRFWQSTKRRVACQRSSVLSTVGLFLPITPISSFGTCARFQGAGAPLLAMVVTIFRYLTLSYGLFKLVFLGTEGSQIAAFWGFYFLFAEVLLEVIG